MTFSKSLTVFLFLRQRRISLWLTCFLVFWFSIGQVSAIGVGVKPKQIDLQVSSGQETSTEFLVVNVGSEPASYQVYPDGLQSSLKLAPTDFRLEPDGSQIVKVTANFKSPGRFATNISIVARPLAAGGLAAASGVKLPINVVVSGWPGWLLVLGAAIVLCLAAFFVVKLRNNKKIKGDKNETNQADR